MARQEVNVVVVAGVAGCFLPTEGTTLEGTDSNKFLLDRVV